MTTQEFDKAVTAFVLAYRAGELRADDEGWITINGTHVLLNENGEAQGGGNLKGMTFSTAKSSKGGGDKIESLNSKVKDAYGKGSYTDTLKEIRNSAKELPVGGKIHTGNTTFEKTGENEYKYEWNPEAHPGEYATATENYVVNSCNPHEVDKAPKFEGGSGSKTGSGGKTESEQHVSGENGEKETAPQEAHEPDKENGMKLYEKFVEGGSLDVHKALGVDMLHGGKFDPESVDEKAARDIDSVFRPSSGSKPLYKGVSMTQEEIDGMKSGNSFFNHTISSTSSDINTARDYAANAYETEDRIPVVMKIKLEDGTPVANAQEFFGSSGMKGYEKETTVGRNTEWKYGKLKNVGDDDDPSYEVDVTVRPASERKKAKDGRYDSAYDEWLEENLDKFEDEDSERDFAQWKSMDGKKPRDCKESSEVESLWKEYSERQDGGPGSGNHGHAGVPGQVGGSAPSEGGESESKDMSISDSLKPSGTGYNYSLDKGFDDFVRFNMGNRRNPKALYDLYHKTEDAGGNGVEAVKDEYYKTRMEMCSKDFKEISKNEANEILADNLRAGTVQAWFREYNHEVKDALTWQMTQSPEVHNAALNIMYDNYKYQCQAEGTEAKPYNEFLTTPIKMYRGGTGQEYDTPGAFSSYTFDRKVAEKFTGSDVGQGASYNPNGVVYEADIRPIDTYGSVFSNGESEILVPRMIAPNKNRDSADEEHVDGQDKKLMGKEAFSDKIFLFGNAYFQKKLLDYGVGCANVTSEKNKDGGPGSGNHGHAGVPGQVGGSAPSGTSEEEQKEPEKGTIEHPSATGSNVPCTGFKDKNHAKSHKRKHGKEFGFTSREEYEKAAIDFIKQPVGGDIDGYKRETGAVVRFNTKTGEFGVGFPGREVLTYFKARYNSDTGEVNIQAANNYFKARKEEEAYDD